MKRSSLLILLLLFALPPTATSMAQVASDGISLKRATPESMGVSSAGIREFIEAADRTVDSMHSFMLVRHGQVVAEAWWAPETPDKQHILWSLSKSFTSTAVGFAVTEGKLSVDDTVLQFFPDDVPTDVSNNLKSMRIRDLLTMSTGHQDEVNLAKETNWVKAFLAHPVPHKPGTHFRYNTPATFMLSAIVQKVTGQTVLEYLTPRLFEPLGIKAPSGTRILKGSQSAVTVCSFVQKILPDSDCFISSKASGTANRSCQRNGCSWQLPGRCRMAVIRHETGIRVTAFSSGAVGMAHFEATVKTVSFVSCCRNRML